MATEVDQLCSGSFGGGGGATRGPDYGERGGSPSDETPERVATPPSSVSSSPRLSWQESLQSLENQLQQICDVGISNGN